MRNSIDVEVEKGAFFRGSSAEEYVNPLHSLSEGSLQG